MDIDPAHQRRAPPCDVRASAFPHMTNLPGGRYSPIERYSMCDGECAMENGDAPFHQSPHQQHTHHHPIARPPTIFTASVSGAVCLATHRHSAHRVSCRSGVVLILVLVSRLANGGGRRAVGLKTTSRSCAPWLRLLCITLGKPEAGGQQAQLHTSGCSGVVASCLEKDRGMDRDGVTLERIEMG
jgi:hypothetical protein